MFVIWWGYINKMGIELDMMGYVWIYVDIYIYNPIYNNDDVSAKIRDNLPPFLAMWKICRFFSDQPLDGMAHLQRNPWTDGLRHFTLSLSQMTRITKEFHGNSWWTRNSEPLKTFADDSPSNIAMEDGLFSSIIFFTYLKWCSLAIHHTYTSYIYIYMYVLWCVCP
jgi:hypothetical protein